MTNLLPLTSEDIGTTEDGKWDLQSVFPKVTKMIVEDINEWGISIYQTNLMQDSDTTSVLQILFKSQEDINYYKLAGRAKEGKLTIFSDRGLTITITIAFYVGTEIYG